MDSLTPDQLQEVAFMVAQLQIVLGQDNAARKNAEDHLKKIKEGEPEKYACYLTAVILNPEAPVEIKSLAAVILRRSIGTMINDQKKTLWELLNQPSKDFLKNNLLACVSQVTVKDLLHKLSNLLVEIAGSMYEENEEVWQDLLNLVFQFVNSANDIQVDAALQIFNGLFSYIIDHLIKYKSDLIGIFKSTLNHANLDIKLASLQAVSNYLQTVEQKDTKPFTALIPDMYNVIRAAAAADDEVVLQDALIEFNSIAEVEPKFFQASFKEIFTNTLDIVGKSDFTNTLIRQQPVEFYVTVIERVPGIAKKNTDLLKELVELIFKLMIDIDTDIEEAWLKPKEGFRDAAGAGEDDEEGEDNVHFGKSCIDKLISAVGDEICLPIISEIVNTTLHNDQDWRYKNAALMAFSQVGEYIDDIEKISVMVPIVLQHLQHPNPKIRYAALHCIGQISDDMTEDFQERYGAEVLPALIKTIEDPVPRVSAHCCSAITNFMDGAPVELVQGFIGELSQKLGVLMNGGISIQKENSVTAFASSVVVIKEQFDSHFAESLNLLLNCLQNNQGPQYKQLRAQIIEAITLISSSVSENVFLEHSARIIEAMIFIQTSNMEDNDPQRSYLLSAWQRICLIMKEKFTPYLPRILPPILSMATLKAKMGIEGQGDADIGDVLQEVKPDEGKEKKATIVTDEIEEKDSAIQMLVVFIEELGAGFAAYIDQVSEIILGLTQYYASDDIRTTCAGALSSLIKCYKAAYPDQTAKIAEMAKAYSNNLIDAMEGETETEVLIGQAQGVKEIIDEAGNYILQPESVDAFGDKVLEFITQSENRVKDNNKYQEENADDEEGLDEEDIQVLKEENKNEMELQISLAELFGAMFKTHKDHCRNLLQKLLTQVLPNYADENDKHKSKFLLFVLDDMVEFLGPDFLGPIYVQVCQQICKYATSKFSAIRQASVYGIGMIAEHGGSAFQSVSDFCLSNIKAAIEFPISDAIKSKKSKLTQFHHARDNAVAALGKVLKYQYANVDMNLLTPYWLDQMPLTHDLEEAKIQNELLSISLIKAPQTVLGASLERMPQIVKILGEICQKKQSEADTLDRLSVAIANLSQDSASAEQFKNLCMGLSEDAKARVSDLYSKCNEEVRARVAASQ